jgi:hypothetical protein
MRTTLIVGTVLLAGCSSQGSAQDTQSTLRADVQALTAAAHTGSLAATTRAATALRADVTRLRSSRALPADRALALNAQVARVLADLTPAAPRPSPTPSPTAQHDSGKGKGKGKGEGDGEGGGGD